MSDTQVLVPAGAVPARKKFYRSHKVIAAFAIYAAVFTNRKFSLGMDPLEMLVSVSGFLTLIGLEGGADMIKVFHEWKARLKT